MVGISRARYIDLLGQHEYVAKESPSSLHFEFKKNKMLKTYNLQTQAMR